MRGENNLEKKKKEEYTKRFVQQELGRVSTGTVRLQ